MTVSELPDFTDYLQEYLRINYPEKTNDKAFIEGRNRLARETFCRSMERKSDYDLAMELAMGTLLKDFRFSKAETVFNILYDEYGALFSRDLLQQYTERFMPFCEAVFKAYPIGDHLLWEERSMELRVELKKIIKQKMDEYWGFEV